MPNIKISQLATTGTLSSANLIPIVDTSAAVTKTISASVLLKYVTGSTFNTLNVTILTGSTTTGSLARFTTISGTNVLSTNLTGTILQYTTISGTNVLSTN